MSLLITGHCQWNKDFFSDTALRDQRNLWMYWAFQSFMLSSQRSQKVNREDRPVIRVHLFYKEYLSSFFNGSTTIKIRLPNAIGAHNRFLFLGWTLGSHACPVISCLLLRLYTYSKVYMLSKYHTVYI